MLPLFLQCNALFKNIRNRLARIISFPNFAVVKIIKTTKIMKTKIFFLLLTMCFYAHQSKAFEPVVFQIIQHFDDNEKDFPARTPVPISGMFDSTSGELTLSATEPVMIESVQIFNNETLVVNDTTPCFLAYDLSVFGSGAYQIIVTTTDGEFFMGGLSF